MFDIGDLLDGDDSTGDSLVGDSLVGDSLVGDLLGDMDGEGSDGDMEGDDSAMGNFLSRLMRRKRGRSAIQRAMLQKEVSKAQLLKTIRPTKKRNWSIPFGPQSVAASTTANIQVQPQVVFRGRRLFIPSPIAPNFNIQVTVGVATQQAQFGFLSALQFVENSVGSNMGLDTAQIGQTITLSAQNTDTVNAHTFQASLLGVAMLTSPC